jgi:hypothetical protein
VKRVLLGAALALAVAVPATAAAPKLFQGWTGGNDVTSNGGSIALSQGGSLSLDGGSVNAEDNFAAPTHAVEVGNAFVRLVQFGPPLARADIVSGSGDPNAGTDTDDPAGSLYLRHTPTGTGELWLKVDATTWVKVAG